MPLSFFGEWIVNQQSNGRLEEAEWIKLRLGEAESNESTIKDLRGSNKSRINDVRGSNKSTIKDVWMRWRWNPGFFGCNPGFFGSTGFGTMILEMGHATKPTWIGETEKPHLVARIGSMLPHSTLLRTTLSPAGGGGKARHSLSYCIRQFQARSGVQHRAPCRLWMWELFEVGTQKTNPKTKTVIPTSPGGQMTSYQFQIQSRLQGF